MTVQTQNKLIIPDEIRHALEAHKQTISWLADETDMYYNTLHEQLTYDRYKQVYNFLKIAKKLNLDVNAMRDRI